MGFIERDEALAALNGLLVEAVTGRGRLAVVGGAAGTGKSGLLHVLAEQAVDVGALAVAATGSRMERNVPLGVFGQLVHDAPLTPEVRARALDLLHEGARAALSSERLEHVDAQVVHALCTVLLELSERCPLLVVVDDVHDADPASLTCLAYLARRLRSARVLVALGCADDGAETAFQTELLRQPHCRRVPLPLLTRTGAFALAAARLGPQLAGRAAAEWFAYSGGNPLLVEALVEDWQDAAREAGEPPPQLIPGDRYGQAVLALLRRGDQRQAEAAEALAIMGDARQAGELLNLSAEEVARDLHGPIVAGLLADSRYRHAAAAEAVLDAVEPERRARLHGRAAAITHRHGAPAGVVAGHLLRAGGTPEPWGVSVLESAAKQALRDGQVEPAVEYLKLAWLACTDERQRVAITTALVRAEWRINPSAPTGHFPELTEAVHRGIVRGYDAVVLAKALLWHGRFDDAQDVLDRVGDEPGAPDQEELAELVTVRSWLRTVYPPFLVCLRPPAEPAPAAPVVMSSVAANRREEALAALEAVLTRGPSAEAIASAERVLGGARLDGISLDTVENAVLTLIYGGASELALPWCEQFIEEAAIRRAPSRQARLLALRAEIALRHGDLRGAERHARRALDIMPLTSWGVVAGEPLATLTLALTAMGRLAEAADCLAQPVPEAMFQTRYGLHYLHARGRHSLAAGHPQAALGDFETCGRLTGEWGLDVPGLVAWRAEAAEACLRLGQRERAVTLVEDQLARCGTHAARTRGLALRLRAAAADLAHRPGILRRASDVLQVAGGDRYELARVLYDLTGVYQALGEFRRAGTVTRRADAYARECGAEPLIRASDKEEDEDAERVAEGPAALLSDAERRVAELAAVGYTNREIAARLYITVSTVEQHLTHTYRKLNISRRADLPIAAEPAEAKP
ncbi:AAA family ATPase [Streptosporangiaceae bacterium NEAU-GS5]|nr:AAA family ATPase [Streptosporangiaceae bacterium NEAU-GS5]